MVSDDSLRPRRALPADDESADPATGEATAEVTDSGGDTADEAATSPRHGAIDDSPDADSPDADSPDADSPDADSPDADSPDAGSPALSEDEIAVEHAAYMRPGSVSDEVLSAAAAVSASPGDDPGADSAGDTERAATSTADDELPAAISGVTPASDESSEPRPDAISAGSSRRRGVGVGTKIGVGILVPVVAVGAYFGVRQLSQKPTAVVTETSSPSARTPTPTPTPAFTPAALIGPDDASAAFGGAGWKVAHTWDTVTGADDGITCMSALPGQPAPILTGQQSLTSTTPGNAAVLHRIDSFATVELAQQAYAQRLAALAACDDVPALIASAAAVTGVGDSSFSMTITFEDAAANVQHTVLLARSGVSVSMTDVANLNTPIGSDKVAIATGAALSRLCGTSAGTCPTTPAARVVAIPKTPLEGWLAKSDIPRITKGAGMWSATDPENVTSTGTQCEDLTLATAEGPIARQQRSYLLTQDPEAPANFGVDQLEFAFADAQAAQTFAETLTTNIDDCATRTETAEISNEQNVRITGENAAPVAGRIWTVTQNIQGADSVSYRVAVMRAGTTVTYLVSNTTDTFDFSQEAWIHVAARAGQRTTQA